MIQDISSAVLDTCAAPAYTEKEPALSSIGDLLTSTLNSVIAPLASRLAKLENSIALNGDKPLQEELEMAKKIRRPYQINGVTCWVSGNTEQEVLENVLRLINVQPNPAPKQDKHNFGAYAENWFEKYSRPNVSTVTAQTYRRQLKNHILPALGQLNAEDITLDDVQALFNGMTGKRETKVKCKNVLNMIFKLAVEEGLMKRNLLESASFRLKGGASEETVPYSVEEMRYLVEHIADLKQGDDRAYLALQSLQPLRLEEVLGLQWQDIDRENMVLHIRRAVTHPTRNLPEIKETKTGKCREVALSSIALRYLDAQRPEGNTGFIVGGAEPCSYTRLRRMCDRIARETGFPGKITPRRFRATVLTDIYEQTGDIKLTQHAAGHTTPELTLKHYVKGRRRALESAQVIDRIYTAENCKAN